MAERLASLPVRIDGLSVRLGQVDTVTHSREQRLALRVFAGRASAAASTSDRSRAALERVVDEATALARITAEDPHAGPPDAATLIEHVPDLGLEDHEAGELTPEQKIETARRAEAAALAVDPRITNSEGAEYFAVCQPAFSPDTVHRESE